MGIQDRDYYREWWAKKYAEWLASDTASTRPETRPLPLAEPVRSKPIQLPPFVAWVIGIAAFLVAVLLAGQVLWALIG